VAVGAMIESAILKPSATNAMLGNMADNKRKSFLPPKAADSGKRPDIDIYVRSAWEANIYRMLLWRKTLQEIFAFAYEEREYRFPVKRGTRFYKPDFTVWEKKDGKFYHIEVKGWMDSKSNTALKRMAKYYPDVEIKVIDKKVYGHLADTWAMIVPNWE
jgi:DNA-binding sugar fermentation-stimulating protein